MTNLRWLAAALLLNAVPLVGQPPAPGEPSEALLEDAASYADQVGVGLDEAVRRLQLQREIGALDAVLSQEERDLFAGLWIEHEPEYRVVVRFTHPSGEERLRARLAGTSLAALVEMRRAALSLVQLEERRANARQLARQLRFFVDTDINVKENRAEIHSNRPQALRAALAAARAHLPDRVEIIAVSDLVRPAVLRGGESGASCTGGFTVMGNNGEVGISTAAHCSNNQAFQGVMLSFRAEDQEGNQDVQWHSACHQFEVSNEFNSGIGNRACIGTEHRDQQAIGSFVCKWGTMSGRTCGFIQSTSISLWYVNSSDSTFVRVDGAFAQSGDSGGPWFVGGVAYGITSGGASDGDGVYMPINFISSIGAEVLISDPGRVCNLWPKATFTWTPTCGETWVNFDASGSYDPDGRIVSYEWQFGDGTPWVTTDTPWISHYYSYGYGPYEVSLCVYDNEGDLGCLTWLDVWAYSFCG